MDCAMCPQREASGLGAQCGITGASVPAEDLSDKRCACPMSLPLGDEGKLGLVGAVVLDAERRGRLEQLLVGYAAEDRQRLIDAGRAYVCQLVLGRGRPARPREPREPGPH